MKLSLKHGSDSVLFYPTGIFQVFVIKLNNTSYRIGFKTALRELGIKATGEEMDFYRDQSRLLIRQAYETSKRCQVLIAELLRL